MISAMFAMEDSDGFARCKMPPVAVGVVVCIVFGALSDYRWIVKVSQSKKKMLPIVD